MSRIVSYFSAGIPSAVATKLALTDPHRTQDLVIYNFEIAEEHPDNKRFLTDCQEWFGQEIITVGNDEYDRSAHKVFLETRYLVGPGGARCTGELKKAMRWEYGRPDDTIVMGYTREEKHRIARLLRSEPILNMWEILIEKDLSRGDVMALFARTGIEIPAMYKLGYRNNNCIGCVKGQAGYWNKIRVDFPAVFARMSQIERELGRTICKREWADENGDRQLERIYLDELPPDLGDYPKEQEFECGIFCQMAEQDIAAELVEMAV